MSLNVTESVWASVGCRRPWHIFPTDGAEEHRAAATGPHADRAAAGQPAVQPAHRWGGQRKENQARHLGGRRLKSRFGVRPILMIILFIIYSSNSDLFSWPINVCFCFFK